MFQPAKSDEIFLKVGIPNPYEDPSSNLRKIHGYPALLHVPTMYYHFCLMIVVHAMIAKRRSRNEKGK